MNELQQSIMDCALNITGAQAKHPDSKQYYISQWALDRLMSQIEDASVRAELLWSARPVDGRYTA